MPDGYNFIFHFGLFSAFTPPNDKKKKKKKNQRKLKKKQKTNVDIIILHMWTINDNHM